MKADAGVARSSVCIYTQSHETGEVQKATRSQHSKCCDLDAVGEREKDGRWVGAADILIDSSVALRAVLKHRTRLQAQHHQEARQVEASQSSPETSDTNFKHGIVKQLDTFGSAIRLPRKTCRSCNGSGGSFDSSCEVEQRHLQTSDWNLCVASCNCLVWPGSFKFGKAALLVISIHCCAQAQLQMVSRGPRSSCETDKTSVVVRQHAPWPRCKSRVTCAHKERRG